MGKHRTAEERLEALQAQMLSLQIQAKKEEIAKNPEVMAIDAKIASLNNDALKWKRWQKDADQKIVDFQSRVSEWEMRKDSAEDWLTQYKEDLATLKAERETIAKNAIENLNEEENIG